MKIRTSLQASVHLTTDERKTLENAVDLLIDMTNDLDNFMTDSEETVLENIIAMEEDAIVARYRLEKILSNIEN